MFPKYFLTFFIFIHFALHCYHSPFLLRDSILGPSYTHSLLTIELGFKDKIFFKLKTLITIITKKTYLYGKIFY